MGEVRAQTSPGTCPVLGLDGASSVGPRLPGPACPVGLWERGQRGCQGMGGHCYARALVGSDSSWLLGVFGARHLTGPWLACRRFSLQVWEGGVALCPFGSPCTSRWWERPTETPRPVLHWCVQHPLSSLGPTGRRQQSLSFQQRGFTHSP